jgi:hypothetical protein
VVGDKQKIHFIKIISIGGLGLYNIPFISFHTMLYGMHSLKFYERKRIENIRRERERRK